MIVLRKVKKYFNIDNLSQNNYFENIHEEILFAELKIFYIHISVCLLSLIADKTKKQCYFLFF